MQREDLSIANQQAVERLIGIQGVAGVDDAFDVQRFDCSHDFRRRALLASGYQYPGQVSAGIAKRCPVDGKRSGRGE